ncbi:MAG: NADH-quinone oxidoreductase subunit G [Xanthomonadales bacterium]|nr:NADH-quinone oxidoreductase subunit NuoG [Gammaproteobacteria bacterium]NNL05560.1 NADH-quinone oxidoreductase subunit G [Xanthomonadales bacterium]
MSTEMETAAIETVSIEVDGVALEAPKGAMIIEVTDKAGIEIPRFCYHPKLSIAANCRMCLVDVEKMPKPVPACATPVMDGMKVYTTSRRAIDAQHGVMEFLLINHPLDCPICDQGGECELQDQAMGYGRSVSRFVERKRVVKDKNVGPLIQTEMTRCIHCTRCVRFLDEIAGTNELGGVGRGDRLEISTCVENSIDSELSGNVIDLCPVGALTNKPFRFQARAWELMARPSIALHDGVGSHLYHHTRRGKVLRTVPRENNTLNETWLTDRDRWSPEGLCSDDRVLEPQVKKDGVWKTVSWDEAVETVVSILKEAGEDVGMLMSPSSANEELFLGQALMRGLGSGNIDHRLRQSDFSDDAMSPVVPQFEMPVAELDRVNAVLLVGCNPRHEAPIVGHRVRQAWRNGAAVAAYNPVDWDFHFDTGLDAICAPQDQVSSLAALAAAVAKLSGKEPPESVQGIVNEARPGEDQDTLARRLAEAENALVLFGQSAQAHGQAAMLRALSRFIASASSSAFNELAAGGNARGAWLSGAVPHRGPAGSAATAGKNAQQMLEQPLNAYVLWGIEPGFDIANPARAVQALRSAAKVVVVASHAASGLYEMGDVILPLAPQPESEGSMINVDGAVLSWAAAATPQGQARSGWKILRRLGGELGLDDFRQASLAELQSDMQVAVAQQPMEPSRVSLSVDSSAGGGLYRIGDVPIYAVDALCRRAEPLQKTVHAANDWLGLNAVDAERLGLNEGARASVSQGGESAEFEVRISERVPQGGAWLRSATCTTRKLGPAFGPIEVEVA